MPFGVDATYEIGQGLMPCTGDLSQATPKVIFDADTSLATSNHQRTLEDQRFHGYAPAIGNIRRVGGIIVTAKVPHYDRKSSWTFRSLNKVFAVRGDTLRPPLDPWIAPRDKDQLGQASALGCSALLKADAALEA